eukprot:254327_1
MSDNTIIYQQYLSYYSCMFTVYEKKYIKLYENGILLIFDNKRSNKIRKKIDLTQYNDFKMLNNTTKLKKNSFRFELIAINSSPKDKPHIFRGETKNNMNEWMKYFKLYLKKYKKINEETENQQDEETENKQDEEKENKQDEENKSNESKHSIIDKKTNKIEEKMNIKYNKNNIFDSRTMQLLSLMKGKKK